MFSEPQGGRDYADRFQNTACPGMAAARCTETRIPAPAFAHVQ